VLDASVAVALASKEAPTEAKANAEIAYYSSLGYEFFAPGVIVSETLYVLCDMLCGKLQDGSLSAATHAKAVQSFYLLMATTLPPPNGEASLVLRAEAIRSSYTCRRSADGIYIALAEQLALVRPTTLLTLDADMSKQAANKAAGVTVHLITP
jgi:predicted nucleic acid-binding protein